MSIILKPLVTEKMNLLGDKLGKYGFVVSKTANKLQIRTAVEKMYGVKVVTVNTFIYGGKSKMRYTKAGIISGRTNSFKKAVVTLAEGEKIDFYSNI